MPSWLGPCDHLLLRCSLQISIVSASAKEQSREASCLSTLIRALIPPPGTNPTLIRALFVASSSPVYLPKVLPLPTVTLGHTVSIHVNLGVCGMEGQKHSVHDGSLQPPPS